MGEMKENHTPTRIYWIADFDDGSYCMVFGGDVCNGVVARFKRRDEAEKFVRAANNFEGLLKAAQHLRQCDDGCDDCYAAVQAIEKAEKW